MTSFLVETSSTPSAISYSFNSATPITQNQTATTETVNKVIGSEKIDLSTFSITPEGVPSYIETTSRNGNWSYLLIYSDVSAGGLDLSTSASNKKVKDIFNAHFDIIKDDCTLLLSAERISSIPAAIPNVVAASARAPGNGGGTLSGTGHPNVVGATINIVFEAEDDYTTFKALVDADTALVAMKQELSGNLVLEGCREIMYSLCQDQAKDTRTAERWKVGADLAHHFFGSFTADQIHAKDLFFKYFSADQAVHNDLIFTGANTATQSVAGSIGAGNGPNIQTDYFWVNYPAEDFSNNSGFKNLQDGNHDKSNLLAGNDFKDLINLGFCQVIHNTNPGSWEFTPRSYSQVDNAQDASDLSNNLIPGNLLSLWFGTDGASVPSYVYKAV